ncbi:hypothetical protein VNO80_06491 [Phaseolus coccineus]|uniref:Uncharacterized protein n=1 Tax=Phaseolus coccineus TaxID=3886 RepID=A0AAN9NGX7_PHACN
METLQEDKNLHFPTADPESEAITFELHAADDQPNSDVSYGLNLAPTKTGTKTMEGLWFVGDAPAALVRSNNDKDKEKNEKKKEERCLRRLKESKTQREDRGPKRKHDRDEVEENRVDVSRREERKGVGRRDVVEKRTDGGRIEERRVVDHRKVSWLTSHIRGDCSRGVPRISGDGYSETRGGPVLVLAGCHLNETSSWSESL